MAKEKLWLAYLQFISLLIIAVCLGFYIGLIFADYQESHNEEIQFGDFSEEISLLRLTKIENGVAKGELQGQEMRLVLGKDEEIVSIFPGLVEFELVSILPNLDKVPAPEGMNFVASGSGSAKYFYPLDHPKADTISAKNRIFFATEEEANQKGYLKIKD